MLGGEAVKGGKMGDLILGCCIVAVIAAGVFLGS